MFCDKYVSTMAADALAPCIVRSSATRILNLQDKQIIVIHDEEFPLQHLTVEKW